MDGSTAGKTFVAGIDGCPGGCVAFKVNVATRSTVVELVGLLSMLRSQPDGITTIAIDIPIGLLESPRACDRAARKQLGSVRGCGVFAAPCRAALLGKDYR